MVAVPLTATFATAGTFTWTCPAGVTSVTVACTGGGGGGGAAAATTGSNGGGGGGAEAALEPAAAVTPGTAYTLTVGAGGAGGTLGGAGASGGDTSFTGDSAFTVTAHGAQGGTPATAGAGQGGAGGTGSTNTVSAAGGAADDGTTAANGGGGGGAAGTSVTAGFPGSAASGSVAGAGGGGTWPGGAGAAGSTSGGGPAPGGSGPGGGGGGALSTGTGRAGGNGADGQVVITWTMNDPVTLSAATAGSVTTFTAPAGASLVTAQAWGGGAGGFSAPASGGGIVGATVSPQGYSTTDNLAAANTFDGFLGAGRVPALTMQKWYFTPAKGTTPSQLPTTVPAGMAALAGAGVRFLVSFTPGGPTPGGQVNSPTELTRFVKCMQALVNGGISFDACFWQEPNNSKNGFTASSYKSLVNYYWTTTDTVTGIAANSLGVKLVYNSASHDPTGALAYYPGASLINGGICTDYYCMSDFGNHAAPPHIALDQFAAQADNDGLPFGLGEWGPSAIPDPLPADFYTNGWPAFIQYIISFFSARGSRYAVMYYSGLNPNGKGVIHSPTDPNVAGIQQVYDALSVGTPAGGAGGGGGEFAQESSLAVTGMRNYVVLVGAGGAGKASGASSTVAGDSVTVTAHGGSVAASQNAGGAGGTGSANTTHQPGGAGGAGGIANGGGGGGGGSGGTAAPGNAGAAGTATKGGAGGAAVPGGGPGGPGGAPGKSSASPVTGPGGGGGALGASGPHNAAGADGQITLSSFVTGPSGAGVFALAPLAFSGAGGGGGGGSFALAPLALAGTAAVANFTQVQNGPIQAATTSVALTLTAPSTAGTLLIAVIASSGTTPLTAPAPWALLKSQATGGAGGHCEMWFYNPGADGITGGNPGGISSVTFTGLAGDVLRGHLAEYAAPAGFVATLPRNPGSASGTASTSFFVSAAGSTAPASLGLALFQDLFSATTSGSWTTPATWTVNRVQTSVANWWASYWQPGLPSGIASVTGTASTSTGQIGWAAILTVFQATPLTTCTGSLAVAPLALAGAGNAVVGPGQVVTSGGLALAPVAFQSPSQAATFPGSPLPVLVELQVNSTWTDITGYVYQRDGIVISARGRPDEASTAQPAQVTMTLNNRDGTFSPQNPAGQFFPFLTRNVQLRISVVNAVTPQGANYTGYRFWGEVPAWPPLWNTAGTDVYVPITAAGVLQRMRQSKYSASPLTRYYQNITSAAAQAPGSPQAALVPGGYWPCEDSGASGTFASGIPGGSPMTFSGTPGLAADTSVLGSAPFAQLNSSVWSGIPGAFSSGGVIFQNPGTFFWTCPGGVTTILAECWGAGAGGSDGRFGCGGGGGEYAAEPALAVTPGTTYKLVVGAGGSGGSGTFSLKGNAGSPGAASTFSGDTKTVTASGGKGLSANSGHAPGGTGSKNTTHNDGGQGGQFRSAGQGGSGGGGSGGSSSAGNGGSRATSATGASGGTAVTGGGPGGTGGTGAGIGGQALPGNSPSPGPGGGGGGGGFNQSNQFGERGGNGYAGQVRLTFGTSTIPPATVLRAVAHVPSTGGTDGIYLAQAATSGTVADLHVTYHTGGNLQLIGKNAGGSTIIDSGSHPFGLNAGPVLVSAELVQAGTKINWKLTAITPGATAVTATYKGSVTGTLGPVTGVNVNNAPGITETLATGIGHVVVQYAVDPILNLSQALNAYNGELAGARFLRLCNEQMVPAALVGTLTDTPQMGPQPAGLLVDLLQDCENADLGQMFERRDAFGLAYRTRVSLQNQPAAVTLDFSRGQLAQGLTPTDDDRLTRNDILATRAGGGTSYEAVLSTGPLSVQDPPNGVGLYSYTVTPNLFADSQLAQFATWLLTLGTLDEYRYPLITVNLIRAQMSDGTFGAMASLNIGDFLQIINPPSWLPPYPINQLAFGFTETLNSYEGSTAAWTITVNAVPEDPYTAGSGQPPLPSW